MNGGVQSAELTPGTGHQSGRSQWSQISSGAIRLTDYQTITIRLTVKSCPVLPDDDSGKPICGLGMTESLLSCLTFL